MTQADQILSFLRVSGVDGRGTLFVIGEMIVKLEKSTTCDIMESMTLLRKIVSELEK